MKFKDKGPEIFLQLLRLQRLFREKYGQFHKTTEYIICLQCGSKVSGSYLKLKHSLDKHLKWHVIGTLE